MTTLRTAIGACIALGLIGAVCTGTVAAASSQHRHRQVSAARVWSWHHWPSYGPQPVTYKLNPYANYRWHFPGVTVSIGDWGSDPVYYPYAHIWSRVGNPHDLACNMPSSPCWNMDRE